MVLPSTQTIYSLCLLFFGVHTSLAEKRSDLLRNKLYYWAVAIETPLADPTRHIKKKQLRDISRKIRRVQLRIHNRKAKCYIPELLVELNSLFKQRDTIRNGNIMRTPHIPRPQKICSVCNYRIDKGYHICKPNPSRCSGHKDRTQL